MRLVQQIHADVSIHIWRDTFFLLLPSVLTLIFCLVLFGAAGLDGLPAALALAFDSIDAFIWETMPPDPLPSRMCI